MMRSLDRPVQELVKEWLESGEQEVPEVLRNDPECLRDGARLTWTYGAYNERYANSALRVHAHFELAGGRHVTEMLRQYCAFFERSEKLEVAEGFTIHDGVAAWVTDKAQADDEVPVFVCDSNLSQQPERVIGSVVRLQPVDECECSLIDSTTDERTSLPAFVEDWKLRSLIRPLSIGADQLPGEMVQARTGVVGPVSDHERPSQRGWLSEVELCDVASRMRVTVHPDFIRVTVDKRGNILLKLSKVFLSSLQFESWVPEGRHHPVRFGTDGRPTESAGTDAANTAGLRDPDAFPR
jgi:hypothetical protein